MPPIIPVLDLMIGQIVLASGGNRDTYRPVHSKLSRSSVPMDVARAIFSQTGCDCLYLADIDSFCGAEPNWNVFNQLLDAGFGLWIDAHWLSKEIAGLISEKINSPQRLKIILSSETMESIDQFAQLKQWIDDGLSPIFSLDKKGDTIITQPGELAELGALELIQQAYQQGVRDLIVLDLESVGTMRGTETEDGSLHTLLTEISQELPDVHLITGGGVRGAEDAQAYLDAGCDYVLVASAIHDCRFTPDDVSGLRVS